MSRVEGLPPEDVLNSKMICKPLTVRDCCLVTDGVGAFVLVISDRGKDMPQESVHVLGNGTTIWN